MDSSVHNIPIGTLVEVNYAVGSIKNGLRLWVVLHDWDYDGTPLYGLSFHKDWSEDMMGDQHRDIARMMVDVGYTEIGLSVII